MKRLRYVLCFVLLAGLMAMGPVTVLAHDYTPVPIDIGGVGTNFTVSMQHDDDAPWAGWINLEVTNTGNDAWGDFHFEVYEVAGFGAVDNVDWDVTTHTPTSSQGLDTWTVNNTVVGATLDLYFYGDPVNPGDTATFSVYNVNPDQLGFFGVKFYPTPVPLPGALLLFGSGLIGLLGFRKYC
ncbi:MAG: PEP-CTERM sorting domain-containing protein [Thermodesulfobacteriota bacterium]|nr:PEP-CTERM sorting domain-containing protein [Thermodesulfobacteriota bacterium]